MKIVPTNCHLFIVANISLIGFLWHFYGSITAYLEYGTKVTFTIEEPIKYQYQYPGITVCIRSVVPYWKLIEKFPELAEDVERIKNEMIERNDTIFWSRTNSRDFTKVRQTGNKIRFYSINSQSLLMKINLIIGKRLKDFYEEKIKDQLTVLELMDDWGNDIGVGCTVYSHPIIDNPKSIEQCDQISPLIETINYKFRCYTFLSQLNIGNSSKSLFTTTVFRSQNDLESYNEYMVSMSMQTNTSRPLDPFDDSFNARVTIHPSQMIKFPGFYPSKRLKDNWGRHYDLSFSKTVSHLLESPYETNCKHYDWRSDIQSYDMCLSICILNTYRDLCHCLPRLGLMYSTKYLKRDDKFCPTDNKCKTLHIREDCAKSCKPDCLQEQYTTEIMVNAPWLEVKDASAIRVGRMPIPDNVYRHSASVSWVQLVSDIGGLGGLWLGLSVIAVTKAIVFWMKDIKVKDKEEETQVTRI